MPASLSAISQKRLQGVHPDLVKVVEAAFPLLAEGFMVTEGLRSHERQVQLYAQGRTVPGKIVTWTMDSQHLAQADGYGHAVDLCPIINGVLAWDDTRAFESQKKAMFAAAAKLGVKLRWGGDWNGNGVEHEKGETDNPHFELAERA